MRDAKTIKAEIFDILVQVDKLNNLKITKMKELEQALQKEKDNGSD